MTFLALNFLLPCLTKEPLAFLSTCTLTKEWKFQFLINPLGNHSSLYSAEDLHSVKDNHSTPTTSLILGYQSSRLPRSGVGLAGDKVSFLGTSKITSVSQSSLVWAPRLGAVEFLFLPQTQPDGHLCVWVVGFEPGKCWRLLFRHLHVPEDVFSCMVNNWSDKKCPLEASRGAMIESSSGWTGSVEAVAVENEINDTH